MEEGNGFSGDCNKAVITFLWCAELSWPFRLKIGSFSTTVENRSGL